MATKDQPAPEISELERLADDRSSRPRQALRARIVLGTLGGETDREVANRLGVTTPTVSLWRRRYEEEGLDGLRDRPRTGRPRFTEKSGSLGKRGRSEHRAAKGSNGGDGGQTFAGRLSEAQLEQLLAAASKTIAQRGFGATRVADIAAVAGVSPATIHYYFRTKEEMLVRTLLWANARLMSDLESPDSGAEDPLVELARFIERTIPYGGLPREEVLLEIDLWSQVRLHPELLPAWEEYCARWIAHVTGIIGAGVDTGRFDPVAAPEEIAERLAALTDGLAAQAAIGADRMPPERARSLILSLAAEQLGIEYGALEAKAQLPQGP